MNTLHIVESCVRREKALLHYGKICVFEKIFRNINAYKIKKLVKSDTLKSIKNTKIENFFDIKQIKTDVRTLKIILNHRQKKNNCKNIINVNLNNPTLTMNIKRATV